MTTMPHFKWKVLAVILLAGLPLCAQKQELGLTLGGLTSRDRVSTNNVPFTLGGGTAFQANYAYRFIEAGPVNVYIGVHLLANPQRSITSSNGSLTKDVASLYLTPNIMVKMFGRSRISPWASIGGGYGDYEQSTTTISGALNPASRQLGRGVLMFGGGVDIPAWRFIALRGEIRDFYTGSPQFNVPVSGGQHNLVVGGGFVIRFGGK